MKYLHLFFIGFLVLTISGCIVIETPDETIKNNDVNVINKPLLDSKKVTEEAPNKITVTENQESIVIKNSNNAEIQPQGIFHENKREGITLIVDDFTFEKKTETYGKLKDITFILRNQQGSLTMFPDMKIMIGDHINKAYNINKDIRLSEMVQDGGSIKRKIEVDLGIGNIENEKEIQVLLMDYKTVLNSVKFNVNFSNTTKLN